MNDRHGDSEHPEDFPWNDVPGDSAVISGTEEPTPAEVVGDDGDEHDLTIARDRRHPDRNHRDTLSERLAEEEPESFLHLRPDRQAALQAPVRGGGDVLLGETRDKTQPTGADDISAEEAAVHIRRL